MDPSQPERQEVSGLHPVDQTDFAPCNTIQVYTQQIRQTSLPAIQFRSTPRRSDRLRSLQYNLGLHLVDQTDFAPCNTIQAYTQQIRQTSLPAIQFRSTPSRSDLVLELYILVHTNLVLLRKCGKFLNNSYCHSRSVKTM